MEEDIFSSEIDSFIEDLYQSPCNNGKVQRKLSRMSLSVPTKGLINAPGENNCYLNASVQLLWHMDVFRRSFRLLSGHACLENACIFCALKIIFRQFQDSNAAVLAADHLRKAMANAFMDDHRFQLGRMDDAAECFENILHRLHNHIANSEIADTCSAKHCIPHQKFGQHILEQTSCLCKATSEPKAFYQFVHYVSASALVNLVHNRPADSYQHTTFGENLKMIMQCGERRPCPDERRCLYKGKQAVTTIQTTLMNCPDVVTVGVIWDSDHPTAKFISSFMDCIGETLYLVDLFDNISDDNHRRIGLNLCGVVAYYGKHYTSFFYNSKDKLWYYFDDENVQELGPEWINAKSKFHRSKFQPLLLTYTNAYGEAVDVEKAPTDVDIVSKEKLLYQPPTSPVNQKSRGHGQRHHKKGRRTHNSSDTLKVPKNNSDDACQSCKEISPRSSRKVSPSKSNTSNTSNDIGQRFDHNTLINDLNESFSNSLHNKESKSTEERRLQSSTSSSGSSVSDIKQTDSNVANDTNTNKTSEFFRKTFNHIKKNKGSAKTNLKPLKEQELDLLKEVSYADVGFEAYCAKQKSNSLPIARSNAADPNEPCKQLQNLERHQELLSIPKKVSETRPEPFLSENDIHLRNRSNIVSDGNLVDLPRSPELVELLTEDDIYYQQGDFESLVNHGEHYANESERFEKEGDTKSALHMCMKAKIAFQDACQISGINASVIQFADLKRMQCVQKEKIFQQQLNLASLKQKVALVLSGGKETNKSTSDSEFESGAVSDNEVRQHPVLDIEALSLTKSANHFHSDLSRNKNRSENSDSTIQSDMIYNTGRSSVRSNISDKGTPLLYVPQTNKSTNESSIKSVDRTSPLPPKKVNTIEKIRQSSQLQPKLYDPSAYTKTKKEKVHQERTIYDPPVSSIKCVENDMTENNESIMDESTTKGNISINAEKFIVENLRRFSDKDTLPPSRCEHCGWKLVENNAKLCFSCQSYI